MSADAFVRCAREQIGKRYVWGTAGPNTFDCSGLVAFCYERVMHEPITRSSHQQFTLGNPVSGPYQAGDLLFWDTMGDGAGHVAIADGDGQIIHALNPSRGIIESSQNALIGGPLIGARRLDFGEDPEERPPKGSDPPKAKRPRRPRRPRKRRDP